MSPSEIWAVVAWVAAAIVLLWNAAKALSSAWQAAKAPNAKQDERLKVLEEWRKEMDANDLPARVTDLETWRIEAHGMLGNDKKQLEKLNDAMEASLQVQLALLDHALNGNNVKQMQDARDGLYGYLTHHNKRA